jgi:hypothetical protein
MWNTNVNERMWNLEFRNNLSNKIQLTSGLIIRNYAAWEGNASAVPQQQK